MSASVAAVGTVGAAQPDVDAKRAAKLHQAARDFESIFVKQLLTAAKIGGDSKESGYSAMAVDALSEGIEKGGGLGLARRIEESLSKSLSAGTAAVLAAKDGHG